MIIKKVLIIDPEDGEAGEYSFKPGANLVVSVDNNQGKSSLLKTMYYGLGLDIKSFPAKWHPAKMIIKLDLYNDRTSKDLSIIRRRDLFYIVGRSEALTPSEYTEWLSEELNVDLKLTYKSTKITGSISRPSALITPFYVDQDESWSGRFYSSSNEVGMYSDTPKRILDYILNISDDSELKAKERLSNLKAKKNAAQIKRDSVNEVYVDYLEENSGEPIEILSSTTRPAEASKQSIDDFVKLLGEANKKYAEHKAIRIKLQREFDQQKKSAEEYRNILKMLNADYDIIKSICKHCRSELTKEQVKTRMDVSTDILELSFLITSTDKSIEALESKIKDSVIQEEESSEEYLRLSREVESNKEIRSIAEYIDEVSKKRSQDEFASIIQNLDSDIAQYISDIKELNKDIRESAKKVKELRQKIEVSYREYVNNLSIIMRGSNINIIEFNDYSASKSSGVNNNQVYLGIYLTYMRLISEYGRYRLPFCIDSFIKNETADNRLESMFEATEKYLMNLKGQSIFSAIESNVQRYMTNAEGYHRINLGKKLLSKEKFQSGLDEIKKIITP